MALVTRGRVLSLVDTEGATRMQDAPAGATTDIDTPRVGRVMPREVVDAHAEAARIVERAHAEAREVTARALRDADDSIRAAAEEARARATADLAAELLAVRARDEQRAEKDLARTTELAVLLAERVVHEALEIDPARIAVMARGALSEVRGARRATIELHPLDAEVLRGHLVGLPVEAIELRPAPELARGDLRLHTDLGTLDARLTVQLERLAAALQDALRG